MKPKYLDQSQMLVLMREQESKLKNRIQSFTAKKQLLAKHVEELLYAVAQYDLDATRALQAQDKAVARHLVATKLTKEKEIRLGQQRIRRYDKAIAIDQGLLEDILECRRQLKLDEQSTTALELYERTFKEMELRKDSAVEH